MSEKFFVGLNVTSFEDNGKQRPISRVTLMLDDNEALTAGDDTGYEIVADCPHATQEMVNDILAQVNGYRYQMLSAGDAGLDPSAELGDGITVGGVYSVISRINDDGNGYPGVTAPGEAEMEDEYPAAGPMSRKFDRDIAETRSRITKTASEIRLEVQNELDGMSAAIDVQLDSITATVKGQEGQISTLEQTADSITATVQGLDKKVSTLEQTDSEIKATVKGQGEAISTLTQTVTGIQTTVKGQGEDITTVTQTANKVNWLIKSGTSSSNFTMTDRAIKLVADSIDLTGFVTFASLSTSGKTEINGDNIKTGTISANLIDVDNLKVKKVYGPDNRLAIYSSGSTLNIGTDGTSSGDYDYVNFFAKKKINIGKYDGDYNLIIKTESSTGSRCYIGPDQGLWDLGSTSHYWDNAYIEKLYLSSTCYITAGDATSIKVGSSTISADSELSFSELKSRTGIVVLNYREFRPGDSYSYSLGGASDYWDDGYIEKLHLSATSVIDESSTGTIRFTSSLIPDKSSVKDLGSSSYYWNYLYAKTIRLYYNSYSYIDLTCNSSKKLCVDGKAIH